MLILTRKVGESIIVGDDVRVSILEIKGRQVRIGIQAPHDVTIHREEIYKMIQAREESGANVTDPHKTPPITAKPHGPTELPHRQAESS